MIVERSNIDNNYRIAPYFLVRCASLGKVTFLVQFLSKPKNQIIFDHYDIISSENLFIPAEAG